jgi:hypothetical protein
MDRKTSPSIFQISSAIVVATTVVQCYFDNRTICWERNEGMEGSRILQETIKKEYCRCSCANHIQLVDMGIDPTLTQFNPSSNLI